LSEKRGGENSGLPAVKDLTLHGARDANMLDMMSRIHPWIQGKRGRKRGENLMEIRMSTRWRGASDPRQEQTLVACLRNFLLG